VHHNTDHTTNYQSPIELVVLHYFEFTFDEEWALDAAGWLRQLGHANDHEVAVPTGFGAAAAYGHLCPCHQNGGQPQSVDVEYAVY
jgi:hypothetical protein